MASTRWRNRETRSQGSARVAFARCTSLTWFRTKPGRNSGSWWIGLGPRRSTWILGVVQAEGPDRHNADRSELPISTIQKQSKAA